MENFAYGWMKGGGCFEFVVAGDRLSTSPGRQSRSMLYSVGESLLVAR